MSTRPESLTRHRRTRMAVAAVVLLIVGVSTALVIRTEREHAARLQAAVAALSPLQEEPRNTLQLLAEDEQSVRRFDAWLLGANLLLVFAALIGLARTSHPAASTSDSSAVLGLAGVEGLPPTSAHQESIAVPAQPESDVDAQALVAVASLCDAVTQTDAVLRLAPVLAQLASVVPATGIVIWSAPIGSQELRAVVTHGYPADLVSRLKPLPRNSDTATATAYRSGSLQVVRARDTNPTGAIVAPLMSAAGCVGCLAVEVTRGIEMSDRARRVVRIVAAAMAGRFADSIALAGSPAADVRSA